ncbi:hypothetical protein [Reinekea thalattae]|uniref:Histone H1 n=1 Tax=Reinekea thalattae TaxID=2593301 RepID=A0A5C8Z9A9_9GAMM|nr:hypothetical protein [Reinekea thalattae]TXR53808.1 hypothetical protein FME95_04415 [Reinekea thalattae]
MISQDQTLEALEQAIEDAEAAKRAFVKENPNGTGDKAERIRLYNRVEAARKSLREYKRLNPQPL